MRPNGEATCSPVTTGRGGDGHFRKGASGNPRGRPPGARHKITVALESLLDEAGRAVMLAAIAKAKDGDATAMRLCLDRLAPARRERCIAFDLPLIETAADAAKASAALIAGVAAGEITPSEAEHLGRLIDSYLRALEATDFDARLRRLEEGTR
jgi:hypothetical protein